MRPLSVSERKKMLTLREEEERLYGSGTESDGNPTPRMGPSKKKQPKKYRPALPRYPDHEALGFSPQEPVDDSVSDEEQ